jgi:hypothetical protein
MALPQLKKKIVAKAPVKAQVEANEVEAQDEEEAAAAPAAKKTLPGKKAIVKKAAPVVEEPSEEEQEAAADEEQGEEEVTGEEDTAGEEVAGEEDQGEEEVAEEEAAPAPAAKKTVVAKKAPVAVKKAGPVATKKPVAKAAAAEEGGAKAKTLFGAARQPRQPKELPNEGSIIPRDDFLRMFAEKEGVTIADARRTLEKFEAFFAEEIFPKYSVNLFGVKFRRSPVQSRIYAGTGGLEVEANPLATFVHEHIAIKASIAIGKVSVKGQVNDDGEFVEGNLDAKGNFVAGTWSTDEEGQQTFTPAAKGKK